MSTRLFAVAARPVRRPPAPSIIPPVHINPLSARITYAMVRPCFLVIDPEHAGSISTRKLVIESAKLNVITAYSADEAVQAIAKFPAVDGVVCNSELAQDGLPRLFAAVKKQNPRMPVIVVGPHFVPSCADYHVHSFDPASLLDLLQGLASDKVRVITRHEDSLRNSE